MSKNEKEILEDILIALKDMIRINAIISFALLKPILDTSMANLFPNSDRLELFKEISHYMKCSKIATSFISDIAKKHFTEKQVIELEKMKRSLERESDKFKKYIK